MRGKDMFYNAFRCTFFVQGVERQVEKKNEAPEKLFSVRCIETRLKCFSDVLVFVSALISRAILLEKLFLFSGQLALSNTSS